MNPIRVATPHNGQTRVSWRFALRGFTGHNTHTVPLIEVGPIRPQQAGHLEPEALVSFSAIQPGTRAAPDAERILQPIPMQLAALLVPA